MFDKFIKGNIYTYRTYGKKYKCIGSNSLGQIVMRQAFDNGDVGTIDYYAYVSQKHDWSLVFISKPKLVKTTYWK